MSIGKSKETTGMSATGYRVLFIGEDDILGSAAAADYEAANLAHHDALTDLPNRILFRDRLQQMMAKARRTGRQVAVLFFDLDRFKKINETLGHDVGDLILRNISRRLESCIRTSDTVARLGGDEFAILLDDIKDTKDVGIITRKIQQRLSEVITGNGYELYTSPWCTA